MINFDGVENLLSPSTTTTTTTTTSTTTTTETEGNYLSKRLIEIKKYYLI